VSLLENSPEQALKNYSSVRGKGKGKWKKTLGHYFMFHFPGKEGRASQMGSTPLRTGLLLVPCSCGGLGRGGRSGHSLLDFEMVAGGGGGGGEKTGVTIYCKF
jgi:hypothetical protein